jgi:phospholipase C
MQLPAITTLAQNFITCDRWFSSVPGPTGPNRLFIHAATSGGYAGSSWKLDATQYTFNSSGEKIPKKGLNCPAEMQTIYESIDHSPGNYNWRYYFHESLNTAMAFPYVRACTQNLKTTEDFFEDAANNNLPSYSFITPHLMVNCQHPGLDGINMVPGDNLIADVYEAIRQNEEVWQKTLLIITYDEAGGYYDSVFSREEVPSTPILNPKGWPEDNVEYDFRYLGVRVPGLLISAWFDHCLDHNLYEHSSILTTLKDLFRLHGKGPDGFLTIRDQNSNNLIAHQKIRDIPRTDLQKLPRSKFQNPEIS